MKSERSSVTKRGNVVPNKKTVARHNCRATMTITVVCLISLENVDLFSAFQAQLLFFALLIRAINACLPASVQAWSIVS